MTTSRITAKTTAIELAAIVSEALEAAGIVATLAGGGAVSAYTEDLCQSEDLDFVTNAVLAELKEILEPMGFVHTGSPRLSVFEHPATRWYVEFPPGPLAFGGTYVDASSCAVLKTRAGDVRIITVTQAIMDRLIASAAWQDAQALDQAKLVAAHQADMIDWNALDTWVADEGIGGTTEAIEFYRHVRRSLPPA